MELYSPPETIRIASWPNFNEMTGGLRMKEFSILCGATGVGKTSFLANLSANLLCQKIKHFVASVETGHEDFVRRVMAVLLDQDVNDGSVYPREQVQKWLAQIESLFQSKVLNMSKLDDRMSMDFLIKKLEYASNELQCKVALLDNLNFFLEVTTENNQNIEMDRAIHELVMFCKRVDMHVILVMHPKKTESGRVETEFDIKGSSTAVQEAHNVFLFNRLRKDVGDYNPLHRELKAAKLRRRGRNTGSSLVFDGSSVSYVEMGMQCS